MIIILYFQFLASNFLIGGLFLFNEIILVYLIMLKESIIAVMFI